MTDNVNISQEEYEQARKISKEMFELINKKNNDRTNKEYVYKQIIGFSMDKNKQRQIIQQIIIDNFDIFYEEYIKEVEEKENRKLKDTNTNKENVGIIEKVNGIEKKMNKEMLEDLKVDSEKNKKQLDVITMYNAKGQHGAWRNTAPKKHISETKNDENKEIGIGD